MEREKDTIIVIADEPVEAAETHAETKPEPPENKIREAAEHILASLKTYFSKLKLPKVNFDKAKYFAGKIKEAVLTAWDKARDYFKSLPKDLSPRFALSLCAVCAAVVVCAVIAAVLIPKSDKALQKGLETLEKRDNAYIAAKSEYDGKKTEMDGIAAELEDKKIQLDEFKNSQGSLDKITQSNAELEKKRDELKSETDAKQNLLDALNAELNSKSNKIITLSSGYYDVGDNISAGNYTITGTGSIAIAKSGKSIANKLLKADGESFSLKSGDRIQIEGSAKLIPE